MRMYLKRAVQWVVALALIQVAVYYWTVGKRGRAQPKGVRGDQQSADLHPYLPSLQGQNDGTCSFETCPAVKPGVLNVHMVPHSHIDVGWLKSVDEYYTGKGDGDFGNTLYAGCVRCIINSTLQELVKSPARTFIFAEMKYFARYWGEASPKEREQIRELIKQRRLEVVNGGWVMSDAGVTVYSDIIDQHTLGFDFIREALGACAQTRTAWHVDQFGHSSEHASIFAEMGYDSLFVGRISDFDKEERKTRKDLEMVWLTNGKNLGRRSALFTHVTFDGYYAPHGFVLENLDGHAFRRQETVDQFINGLKNRAVHFKTNHLLVPMGSDFGYRKPELWFNNMDDAIHLLKSKMHSDVNLIYSTPSCYIYHVNQELQKSQKSGEKQVDDTTTEHAQVKSAGRVHVKHAKPAPIKLSTKTDDFLPYITDAVWAGFYTTRGGLKRHIWQAGQILRSCKQLAIFSGIEGTFQKVNVLRDAVAVMQHHDAITGTQKRAVLDNYNLILSNASLACEQVMSDAYKNLWGAEVTQQLKNPQFCHGLNMSSCEVTEKANEFLVTAYNPLTWKVALPVRFPAALNNYSIYDKDNKLISYQILPVPQGVQSIPERSKTSPSTELTFVASLPPLSVTSFLVKSAAPKVKMEGPQLIKETGGEIVIENEYLTLTFSRVLGLLLRVHNKASKVTADVSQDFLMYTPGMEQRNEGAYVFVPGEERAKQVRQSKAVAIKVFRGPEVQEVHQDFGHDVTQVVRLYKGSRFAEFHWTVGKLDISYESRRQAMDVVSRFTSSIDNKKVFYTDSNGRGMMKRVTTQYHDMPQHNIAGNYYPITSRIFIKDRKDQLQLTILPDRPQGGSSLSSGSIELMVHRRSLSDDGLGMQEPLNDMGADGEGIFYTGKHYLLLDTVTDSGLTIRHKAWETHLAPTLMFTELKSSQGVGGILKQHTFLSSGAVPDNVHLLTLDRITENDTALLLVRLEHALERDAQEVSRKNIQPAVFSLENMFKPFTIISAEETTMGGNFNPGEINRMEWISETAVVPGQVWTSNYEAKMTPPFRVVLPSLAIRTFRVKIALS